MALVKCDDCGREVSDRAPACPSCGAPVASATDADAPTKVALDGDNFVGTKEQVVRLAVKAVQACNYKVDSADETSGIVSFTTGMTMGSWSGVSGSVFIEEVGRYRYRPSGNAKQNVKGGQMLALDCLAKRRARCARLSNR